MTVLGLCAGALWGGLALLLAASVLGSAVWPGVLASPVIGATVARLTHPGFARSAGLWRALWSLASLYGGAMLFALVVAGGELLRRDATGAARLEVALQPVLAVLWGLTLSGFVLLLWPLAYLTHRFIEWRLD